MFKDLKLSYILFFVFSSILVAWRTLSQFFHGVAINFIALLALAFVILLICHKDRKVFNRIKDLLLVAGVFCTLELVIYFSNEFGYGEFIKGFIVYQNIISFLGMLFMAYIGFRFALDLFNKKLKFIEVMLGNEKITRKPKKAKELSNGSLEDKPNNKTNENPVDNEENEIIIETEE